MPAQDFLLVTRRGEQVTTRVDAPEELEGELAAGTRVGRIAVLRDGKVVRRVPLVTAAEVPGAGPLRVVLSTLGLAIVPLLVVLALLVAAIVRRRRRHPNTGSRRGDREARRRERERARAG